jgi:hypothetical protein
MLSQQRVRAKGRIEDAEEKEVKGNENNEEDELEKNKKDGEEEDAEEKGKEDEDEEDRNQDQEGKDHKGEDQEGREGNKEHPQDYKQVDQLDKQLLVSSSWKDPGKAQGTKQRSATQKAPDTPSKKSKKSSGDLVSPTVPFFNKSTNWHYSYMSCHALIVARWSRSAKLTSWARLTTGATRRKSSVVPKKKATGTNPEKQSLASAVQRTQATTATPTGASTPPPPIPLPPQPPPLPTRLSVAVCTLPIDMMVSCLDL